MPLGPGTNSSEMSGRREYFMCKRLGLSRGVVRVRIELDKIHIENLLGKLITCDRDTSFPLGILVDYIDTISEGECHKRTGRKNLGGLPDTKPIVCQYFCPTKGKNLPKRG